MASESPSELTSGRSPEEVDRVMVGVCGAIWLAALAATVFAFVALSRLARGHAGGAEQSSWVLYSVIIVSALVILGAIPLLLRARRNALADGRVDAAPVAEHVEPIRPTEASTEKIRVFGVDPYAARRQPAQPVSPALVGIVDRLWLRGTVSLLGAMGLAFIGVAVGANLLANGSYTGAWVAFGVAGVITVAMPAVLAFFQRQLGEAVEEVA